MRLVWMYQKWSIGAVALKLLFVDDEVFNHEFIRVALQQDGYDITCVSSGQAALDWLYQQLPDLLVVDMVMPGLSGLDLCRLLRHNPETASLPILVLSGMDNSAEVAQAFAAGADAFLSKPIQVDQLRWKITQMLSGSSAL